MGTKSIADTAADSANDGSTFKKDGWNYKRLSANLSDQMFSDYSDARAFFCRPAGCFEQSNPTVKSVPGEKAW